MKNINKFKKHMLAGMAVWVASILLSTGAFAQTTRTVCASGCDHASIAAAVTWVNNTSNSITGGVTFSIPSGWTETPAAAIVITRSGTATDYIKFVKASGTNPLITAHTGGSGTDAVITLSGADYVTIDGIDIQENSGNNTNNKRMEYGFLIKNASATDGAQFNTIQNATITLTGSATPTGIFQTASTTGGGFAATNVTGANSNNTYENLTINAIATGISLLGTTGFEDLNTKVNKITIGASAISFGGNITGINLSFQSSATVTKNIIKNLTATSNGSVVTGIAFVNGAGSNLINNNVIYNLNTQTGGNVATLLVKGISINGNAGTFNIDYNSVNIATTNINYSSTALEFTDVSSVNAIRNNIFLNTTGAQSNANTKHYAIVLPGSSIGATGSLSNNNDLYVANTNGFVGKTTADQTALSDWATATSNDAKSINLLPTFTGDLVLDAATTSNWYFNGAGVQVAAITSDINNNTIPSTVAAGAPDLGAYQFTPSGTPPALTMTGTIAAGNTNTFTFNGRTVASITWDPASTAVPTSVTMYYYPGTDLFSGQTTTYEYFNSYWQVDATGTGPYNYSITLNYLSEEIGNVAGTPVLAKTMDPAETSWAAQTTTNGTNSMTATGLTSFSRFTGTGTITPLPVNLTAFNAIRKGETAVALSWTTRGELNNDRFEIERSSNGVDFITVGTVFGNGTTNNAINYQFEDLVNAATNPVLYYRLKQVDYNGAFEYSAIKRVVSTVSVVDVKAWYNQSSEKIQVSNIKTVAEPVTITVYDMQGRVVAQQFEQFTKGNNTTEVNLQGLNNGIYTFMISSESGNKIQKIVKY